MSIIESVIDIPVEYQKDVFGQFDSNIKKIEKALHITIVIPCRRGKKIIETLISSAKAGENIDEQKVNYAIALSMEDKVESMSDLDGDIICRTIMGKPVKPKTFGQKKYVDMITKKMITFGIGPAGTGKTYLAMAKAITAFKNDEVSRIILTRPAIEAGENK